MKIVKILLALVFVTFAVVQYNDPDPLLWIIVYAAMVIVCVLAVYNIYPTKAMIVMAGGYLVLSVLHFDGMVTWLTSADKYLLFDDLAKMQYPYIEEAREFLGLIICVATLIWFFYLGSRKEAE